MGKNFIRSSPEIDFRAYLFNNFLCDLFFIKDDIDFARYADDNTSYTIGNDMEDVIFKLQNSSKIAFLNIILNLFF